MPAAVRGAKLANGYIRYNFKGFTHTCLFHMTGMNQFGDGYVRFSPSSRSVTLEFAIRVKRRDKFSDDHAATG